MYINNYSLDTVLKQYNSDPVEGIIACGFLPKKNEIYTTTFNHYGGFLVLSGKGEYVSELGERYRIRSGDFVQRRPGIKHTTIVDGEEPWIEFFICFGPSLYKILTDMKIISNEPIIRTTLNLFTLKKCEALLWDFKNVKEGERKNLFIEIQKFMLYINSLSNEKLITEVEDGIIQDVIIQLSKDFNKKLDFQEIGKTYQLSYDNLRKMFKRKTGYSLHHFRISKRINEACRLLEQTDSSIKSIAISLNYSDQYAFSNQFKQIIGVSPRIFRDVRRECK